MQQLKRFLLSCLLIFFSFTGLAQDNSEIFTWSEHAPLPNPIGLNGSFSGVHNDALIIAGGANFPNKPVWEGGKKVWYNSIYVLEKNGSSTSWIKNETFKLPKAMANGVSISTPNGLLCIGGDNEEEVFSDVFLLKWNPKTKSIEIEVLPSLPVALSSMGGSLVDDTVYLVGGKESPSGNSTANFLSLNIKANLNRKAYTWEQLPAFPGTPRTQPVVVGQSNGHQNCLYVFSGLNYDAKATKAYQMLDDVYEFNPHKNEWTQKKIDPQ